MSFTSPTADAEQFSNFWIEFSQKALENPQKIAEVQLAYNQQYLKICQNFSAYLTEVGDEGVKDPLPSPSGRRVGDEGVKDLNHLEDKRFRDPEWQNNRLFNFIKQHYLLTVEHAQSLVKEIIGEDDPKLAIKINFYTRQFMDAFSPTNFIGTNPEVLRTTMETGGKNLLQGFKHFLGDLENSNGFPAIKMTEPDYFKVGENIAITPGKVIYQNEVMQLIQYEPTTKKVYQNPLLIIPPWINKYYILDLRPENSWVKWLVDRGQTVFMISWINPAHEQADKNFADYMFKGIFSALDTIEKSLGKHPINVVGYCVGGTLLGAALAYAAEKNDTRINSATFLVTLLDFSEPGDLGVFIDEGQINAIEKHMQIKGYLDGKIMAAAFNSLRANELIWNNFINNYLKGKRPLPFDFLYWNSDATNLPATLHSYYLREMYLHNRLIQRNALKILDVPLDLKKIAVPSFFLATKGDHIVPWAGSYKGFKCLSGSKKFLLAGSGHVAGVINPPHKNKYGYWLNNKKPKNPETWLVGSKYHEGSWWNAWAKWIKKYNGDLVDARHLANSPISPLEDAPGSYVKVRLDFQ